MIEKSTAVPAEEFFQLLDHKAALICEMNEIIDRGRRRHQEHGGKKPRGIGLQKHHVTPTFCGGADSEIIFVTREEHRRVHELRYLIYGHLEDKRGAGLLSGHLTDEELLEIARESGKAGGEKGSVAANAKMTSEQKSRGGKVTGKKLNAILMSIRWRCLVHGDASHPGVMGSHRKRWAKMGVTCEVVDAEGRKVHFYDGLSPKERRSAQHRERKRRRQEAERAAQVAPLG